jgi:putrescine transport system ATP-binding protein
MALSVRDTEPWLDPDAAPHIRVERLVKRFGDTHAVDDVSANIYRGELFALLGGSGCGKTTLLRMLAGFVTPDSGAIMIAGKDVGGLPPYERPVNMMFQSYALFPHMSVADNIAFGLRRDGLDKAEIGRRVGQVLELVQMAGFAKRKPQQLSGGQRQRVALARAIVKRPQVLLLDEPLSALDKKLREATQFELINIQEQIGITFIMVTHDQEEAMTLATRIAVMDKGKIVQIGKPNEIYEHPQNRFVADFIGSVNLFDGYIGEVLADRATVVCEALGADFTIGYAPPYSACAAVCLAVRPEQIMLAKADQPVDWVNRLTGRIKDMAYLGDTSVYHVALDNGKLLKATAANLGRWEDQPFERDEVVQLGWAPTASIVLDP